CVGRVPEHRLRGLRQLHRRGRAGVDGRRGVRGRGRRHDGEHLVHLGAGAAALQDGAVFPSGRAQVLLQGEREGQDEVPGACELPVRQLRRQQGVPGVRPVRGRLAVVHHRHLRRVQGGDEGDGGAGSVRTLPLRLPRQRHHRPPLHLHPRAPPSQRLPLPHRLRGRLLPLPRRPHQLRRPHRRSRPLPRRPLRPRLGVRHGAQAKLPRRRRARHHPRRHRQPRLRGLRRAPAAEGDADRGGGHAGRAHLQTGPQRLPGQRVGLLVSGGDRGRRGRHGAKVQALHPGAGRGEQADGGHRRERAGEVPARGPLEFEVRELEEATSKFARKIGSGGFGVVYYGRLGDGREIAVKVASSNESIQGKKQLANEVALLSRIHHRNLVAFLGYCWERDSSSYMLVYEYMHNGSLKEQLQMMSISWLRRLQVAEDAAKGIEYLHCGCTPAIIHRDIKTSNILLDAHMRAKVSDLGLSKSNKATNSTTNTITTHVRGTLGYLDPHYYVSQQLTHKSDLYSFGIILLELISGRPPILLTPGAGAMASLGPWAKSHYESGDIEAIVDPSLRGRYRDVHSVWKVAETAVRCIDADPRGRPSMPEVVKDIQEAIALEMPSSESERPAASFFSPGAGAAGARSSATVRSHDLVMDNLMYDSSFCDSLNLPRTPR
ncbi:Os01g0976900, partial [Oryza sativa Japonica Group]